ncbi:MAG: OmpA family protein [Archangiaceae bacterium]|nr:OmpA family protein [Archangiaceae bacterium]
MKRLLVAVVTLVGCAHQPAPAQLIEARQAYGQMGQVMPADGEAARATLAEAEREYVDNGDSLRTRDLAYAASRRIDLAKSHVRTARHQQQVAALEREAAQLKQSAPAVEVAVAPPGVDGAAVSEATPPVKTEPEVAPAASEPRVAVQGRTGSLDAPSRRPSLRPPTVGEPLSVFAESREAEDGTLLTIPASLLFTPGSAELSDGAQARLAKVADAAGDGKGTVLVTAYTDNQGSDNKKLSTDRAKAVRDALVGHGVSEARLEVKGAGDANPRADNSTPEGRATNRRVEILLPKN